jgi:hypothetical protein
MGIPIWDMCLLTAPLPQAKGTASTPRPFGSFLKTGWNKRGMDGINRFSRRIRDDFELRVLPTL